MSDRARGAFSTPAPRPDAGSVPASWNRRDRRYASVLGRPHKAFESFERFRADMMLDTFSVVPGHLRADAENKQEGLDDLVPSPARVGNALPSLGEEHAAIGTLRDQAFLVQTLYHLGDSWLRDAEPLCNVDLSGFTVSIDQIRDEFDVILD